MEHLQELFDIFSARTDVYSQCWLPRGSKKYLYKSIKEPYTTDVLEKHITDGRNKGIGIYPLLKEDQCRWVAADFDMHDDDEIKEVYDALERIRQVADGIELPIYTEKSKSGNGLHIWIFFSDVVQSWKARKLMMALITGANASNLSSMDRLFPSQDRLHQGAKGFGNLIHMPFSAHFTPKGTVFFDADGTEYTNDPDDIEMWLGTVTQVTPTQLDVMLDQWDLLKEVDTSSEITQDNVAYQYAEDGLQQVLQDPFIQWCRDYPKDVDYNAWIAMIANLIPYGEAGKKAIHDLSSLDPSRYDKTAVDRKIIACQGMKPVTYDWIVDNSNFNGTSDEVQYKSPAAAGVKSTGSSGSTPVFESYGGYWIRVGKENRRELSNFTLTPVYEVNVDGNIERLYNIHTDGKVIKAQPITAEILADVKKFKTFMLKAASNATFYGNGTDLMRVINYIKVSYPNIETIHGKSAVGLYQTDKIGTWTVLTQARAWNRYGDTEELMYYNLATKKRLIHDSSVKLSVDDMKAIKPHLFMFNNLAIAGTVVGWMAANMVAPRLRALKGHRMPCIAIHGQAGCGKTQMARVVMHKFFGDIDESVHVGDVTRFMYVSNNASSNMFPMFYDEYKPSQWAPQQKKLVSEAIRGTYDGNVTRRGRADLTSVEYPQIAPAVYIGEEGFTETALVERSVEAFMSKEESFQYTDNFLELKRLPMQAFGNAFLNWTLTLTDQEILDVFQQERLPNKNADRPIHNVSMLLMGLELMSMFYKDQGLQLITDPVKEAVTKAQKAYTNEHGVGTRAAVDFVIEAMVTMMEAKALTGYEIKMSNDDMSLFINVREAYPKFKKWARETDYSNEMIGEAEFNKQIKRMSYYEDYRSARMGSHEHTKIAKVRVLSVEKLQNAGLLDVQDDSVVS